MPPASSSSSRRVIPSGASYWPGRCTCPDTEYSVKPGDFTVPKERNQAAPLRAIVGVDHQVVRLAVALRDEPPLHPGGEAGTAAATQPGGLDQRDHGVGVHRQGGAQAGIAVVALVGFERPRPRLVPERAEDGGQGHGQVLVSGADAGCAPGRARSGVEAAAGRLPAPACWSRTSASPARVAGPAPGPATLAG